MLDPIKSTDFDAIRLKVAGPEVIRTWSYGEVLKPETINYRTQKPEKDGLFCEKIFGPSKDWECYCGKYKKIRYRGIVCDKCGVEVTRSIVRRERMGHIELIAPVAHIWFLRGVPSKIGLALDLSVQNLEKVIYFASFIITLVNENLKKETLEQIKSEYKQKKKSIESDYTKAVERERTQAGAMHAKHVDKQDKGEVDDLVSVAIEKLAQHKEKQLRELDEAYAQAKSDLDMLKPLTIITEAVYHDLSLKYGHIFEAGIGAEAIHKLLSRIDLNAEITVLEEAAESAQGAKEERLIKRLKLFKNFYKNDVRPEWMILTALPVIPPDLRPMVPLDGGRFATSDLNDLYRRVINRNNRLKQLVDLNAPEVICRNEKRMLQEAVDALIDNSARHGKTVIASTGQKRMLKSIADMLKGKQGRFRQNLLGKRTDYSGRSVIVVGPHLKLSECGLPKQMALELFRPFVISRLIAEEYVYNVRSGSRFIESGRSEVWDILEDIVKDAYVFLNRAPTLHRLGIQAFKPVLIEGKAIQIHPLVCTAFNADFDGDQMAVHVPLTVEAREEAATIMLSSNNLLKPATGTPVVTPNQDVVWGCFYLTYSDADVDAVQAGKVKMFSSPEEAKVVYANGVIKLQDPIVVRFANPKKTIISARGETDFPENGIITTTVGRIIFNDIILGVLPYYNMVQKKKDLGAAVQRTLELAGQETTVNFLDELKNLGFAYLTISGLSWGMDDVPELPVKQQLIAEGDAAVEQIEQQYAQGLLSEEERYGKIIETWTRIKDAIVTKCKKALPVGKSAYSMIESGARGSWGQLTQIMGMKGLVTNPAGAIIELPVKANFREGFDVLEFFISTHGTRKGLSDTALRTANAGYLTRRLVDVAQDLVVREEDCGDEEGLVITREESDEIGDLITERLVGRWVMEDIKDEKTKKILIKRDTLVTEGLSRKIAKGAIASARIRSAMTCKTLRGICQKCYGYDLAFNKPVKNGVAVGIIAAQSIGEPGTQLTMRTFHTGGVAGADITQGLPRVEELFEVRPPKRKAIVADVGGVVSVMEGARTVVDVSGKEVVATGSSQKTITIVSKLDEDVVVAVPAGADIKVKQDGKVTKGMILFTTKSGEEVMSPLDGAVSKLEKKKLTITGPQERTKEYLIPKDYAVYVKSGDLVAAGSALTEGSLDLQQMYQLQGKSAVQKYIIKEIQYIYASQGQKLNDKHIEVIVRQLFSRVRIKKSGDTDLLPGEVVERAEFLKENAQAKKEKGGEAIGEELLLGITKVSLSTSSFLSAASFQETARVLINAAVSGKVDRLEGLKENVIIGRLIPAGTGFEASQK